MDAINAIRMQSREMADGTIEVKIHVDKSLRHEFHRLFPDIGYPIAIAPLNLNVKTQPKKKEPVGEMCKMAGYFCNQKLFWKWCHANNEQEAKEYILARCNIQSRRELDENETAKQIFLELVRKPFLEYRAQYGNQTDI